MPSLVAQPVRPARWVLFGILTCAFVLRAAYASTGVPFAVGVDEPAVVDRALRILQTGDWNPHVFDYPTLVIYLQTCATAAYRVLVGLRGHWLPVHALDLGAVYETGRLVAALIGTATVWLTYRVGKILHSRALGLVAAAQLAVYPMHVRESHFSLTDVPTTALVTLTLLLAIRAGRRRTVPAYAWAGCAAGLSAGAKYNGAVVAGVVALVWVLHEQSAVDKGRKAFAAASAMVASFVAVVPYAILDWPTFSTGLASQVTQFSWQSGVPIAPPWHTYLLHLSAAWSLWLPLVALGTMIVAWRRRSFYPWLVPMVFVAAYFGVLATHRVVFGRYTLPLLPSLCLLAAVPIVELADDAKKYLGRRAALPVLAAGALGMTAVFAAGSITWLEQFRQPDTRSIAARWMIASLPPGARVAVAYSGPTYLDHAGFNVVAHPNRIDDQPFESYMKGDIDYIVISPWSAATLPVYDHFLNAGDVVFGVDATPDRWGPLIRIVKLSQID